MNKYYNGIRAIQNINIFWLPNTEAAKMNDCIYQTVYKARPLDFISIYQAFI